MPRSSFPSPRRLLAGALLASLVSACGRNDGNTGPSPNPAFVQIVSGEDQVGSVGDPLPDSLVVRVEDAEHDPIAGVTVTWRATQAGLTSTIGTGVTNAAGLAKLGFTPTAAGVALVTATVEGPLPASFMASVYTHPTGTLGPRAAIDGQPFAVAVSRDGLIAAPQVALDKVTFLDTLGATQGTAVDVGNEPVFSAFSPDASRLYVANRSPSNSVAVVNVTARTMVTGYAAPGSPFGLILSPDGSRLYVAGDDSLRIYAAASGTQVGAVALGDNSEGLAFDHDASRLYVSTRSLGTVLEISIASGAVLRTFTLGGRIQGVAVRGTTLYAADQTNSLIKVVNLTTGDAGTPLDPVAAPYGLAISPDGKQLWATLLFAGKVGIIDLASGNLVKSVNVAGRPRGIAFGRWGTFAVVANEFGYVDIIR